MERRWHAALPMMMAGFCFLVLPVLQGNLLISMLCLCLASIGLLSATGPYWTLPSAQLSGSAAAGGIALVTTVGGFGAFVASTVVGWINDTVGAGYAGLWFYAALALIGPVLMLISTKPGKE
jgi:hypothetical protein